MKDNRSRKINIIFYLKQKKRDLLLKTAFYKSFWEPSNKNKVFQFNATSILSNDWQYNVNFLSKLKIQFTVQLNCPR